MATDPADIPHGMRRVYRRFERWRSEHSGARLPIPEVLWVSAAEVAREHGASIPRKFCVWSMASSSGWCNRRGRWRKPQQCLHIQKRRISCCTPWARGW